MLFPTAIRPYPYAFCHVTGPMDPMTSPIGMSRDSHCVLFLVKATSASLCSKHPEIKLLIAVVILFSLFLCFLMSATSVFIPPLTQICTSSFYAIYISRAS